MSTTSEHSPPKADQQEKASMKIPKKLIVCCDGTWMDSDNGWVKGSWGRPGHLQTPSNVTRIARAIKNEDDDHHPQIVYYQAGLGTGLGLYDQLMGGGTGMGLAENIREAYAFVASNYSPHEKGQEVDKIFLMGFSRGAFTARSLGGFIAAVGILTKKALPFFYQCFEDWERAGDKSYTPAFFQNYAQVHPEEADEVLKAQPSLKLAHDRKQIDTYMAAYFKGLKALGLTQEVKIEAIGCWDTVGALGVPLNPVISKTFHLPSFLGDVRWFDTRLSTSVKHAFHALAMDEHRAPFSPALWELDPSNNVTQLKQVWFSGAHGNIGGSYEDTGAADITLAWMMDHLSGKHIGQAPFKWSEWIQFDDGYIEQCLHQVTHYYDSIPEGKIYRGWGLGKIWNSSTFPQNLAGETTRTPGKYHQTDYITSNYTDKFLQNTHEHVHSSVRVRLDMAGRSLEPTALYQKVLAWLWRVVTMQTKPAIYAPQKPGSLFTRAGPLYGWKLEDGHQSHKTPNGAGPETQSLIDVDGDSESPIKWRYHGPDTLPVVVMSEDVFAPGGYEEQLLAHDKAAAEVVYPASGGLWPRKPSLRKLLAHTF